ncbi:MAG: HAD family hydrolase [Nitrospiraceae bacterium]
MTDIAVLFWDIGGVMLTNGWDQASREEATRVFKFDSAEFEARHAPLSEALDCGRLSLDEYLDQVLFNEPRSFTKEAFKSFMYAQSQPCSDVLQIVKKVAQAERYLVAALNNESLELNRYRIERFQLGGYCDLFLSSCYLGVRKPDEKMYCLALQLTQRAPEECLFIDDRAKNLEPAQRMGMNTIHYQDSRQLRQDLRRYRVIEGSHD